MKNISAKARLARAQQLLKQTEALPELYIENDQEYFYGQSSKEEKEEGKRSLKAKRDAKTELQLQVRSFIKLAYGDDSEYSARFARTNFTFEEMGMMYTGLDAMNKQWSQARHSLIWLFKNMIAEESERAKMEKLMIDNTMRRQWASTLGCLLAWLLIWNSPQDYMVYIFNKDSLLAVRFILSISAPLLAAAFVYEEKWRELLITSILTTLLAIVPFLKNASPTVETPVRAVTHQADSTVVAKKDSVVRLPAPKSIVNRP